MFFTAWDTLIRTIVVGVLAYAAIVLLVRISGKRTLAKWNAFDLVVTIALGSSLATVILSKTTSLAQGVLAFTFLIVLQLAITWLSVRSPMVEHMVKAKPCLLVYRGVFQDQLLRRERVTESEVRAGLRAQGIANLVQVAAVILETDGSFSVIRELGPEEGSTLADVEGLPPYRQTPPEQFTPERR